LAVFLFQSKTVSLSGRRMMHSVW